MKKEILSAEGRTALEQYGLGGLSGPDVCLLRFDKGETVCSEGHPLPHLLLILAGRAKVCGTAANGNTVLFSFYSGSGILGEVELLSSSADATTTVQAVTEFLCVGLPPARLVGALSENPVFLGRVARSLAEKLARCTKVSAANLSHPLEQRLCAYLIASGADRSLSGSLTELSELLGTSYRHLLRTLKALCAKGALEKRGGSYLVRDRAALARLAGECSFL